MLAPPGRRPRPSIPFNRQPPTERSRWPAIDARDPAAGGCGAGGTGLARGRRARFVAAAGAASGCERVWVRAVSGVVARRSGRRVRWAARAPRLVAIALVAVLAVAGLRAAVAPPPAQHVVVRAPMGGDVRVEGFAQAFARAYLSWDARRPEQREGRLASFLSAGIDPDAGYLPPDTGSEVVVWTAAVQNAPSQVGRTVVVAVETTRRTAHLAVPIARDERGFLFVATYPAFVGGPATNTRAELPADEEVEDEALRRVVSRALRNYLERSVSNLRADLDPHAVVSLPDAAMRVRSVQEVTTAEEGRVAALVSVSDPAGGELTLRYELRVVRRDRWYVRSIAVDPTGRRS